MPHAFDTTVRLAAPETLHRLDSGTPLAFLGFPLGGTAALLVVGSIEAVIEGARREAKRSACFASSLSSMITR